jgi:Uma2 family endonuclease
MLLELKRFSIPPGQKILLHDVSWQEFEEILDELGDHRAARVAYADRDLEIMTPLPEHEDDKEITSDLVKALLEELETEFRCLGSTTFKNEKMAQGIEPDQCFYIQNERIIRGKKRLDLSIDPPPDLALEIDLTSRTHPNIYEKLRVPELWRFEQGTLQINILQGDQYAIASESQIFPGLNLREAIPKYLKQSKTEGRNVTLKAFRKWIRANLISDSQDR